MRASRKLRIWEGIESAVAGVNAGCVIWGLNRLVFSPSHEWWWYILIPLNTWAGISAWNYAKYSGFLAKQMSELEGFFEKEMEKLLKKKDEEKK